MSCYNVVQLLFLFPEAQLSCIYLHVAQTAVNDASEVATAAMAVYTALFVVLIFKDLPGESS